MKDAIQGLIVSTKTAVVSIATTAGTGLAAVIEWIPADIAKVGIIPAAGLSCMLCYVHYKRLKMDQVKRAEEAKLNKLEYEKDLLELEILRERRHEQVSNASRRRSED